MNGPAWGVLRHAPSVQQLVSAIVEGLSNERSILVMIPDGIDGNTLDEWITDALRADGLSVNTISVIWEPDEPLEVLERSYCVTWPDIQAPRTTRTLQTILEANADIPRVLVLTGLHGCVPARIDAWVRFVSEWAAAAHAQTNGHRSRIALCAVVPASYGITAGTGSDTYLETHEWFGAPSQLELCMVVRAACGRRAETLEGVWRATMLPSLAGTDLALIDELWDCILEDIDAIVATLEAYGHRRGWEPEIVERARLLHNGLSVINARPATPPNAWRSLWTMGAADWTPEHGPEAHSSVLALTGDIEQLRHRIWRAQSALLLPYLDQLRLAVCRRLEQRWGKKWIALSKHPNAATQASLEADPLSVEWGHLYHVCRNRDAELLQLAAEARDIRNKIAHYDPVMFPQFRWLYGVVCGAQAERLLG